MNLFESVRDSKTLALVTFRRDGREVATPVNFVVVAGHLYVNTRADSGKVKRLRNDPRIRFAPCTLRGRVIGEWREGTARVLPDPSLAPRIHTAMSAKYGWFYPLAMGLRRIFGRGGERTLLQLSMPEA